MPSVDRLTCYVLAGVLVLPGCGTLPTTERSVDMGLVENLAVAEGCGCVFGQSRSGERNAEYIWVEDIDGNAWINIDGNDVRLSTNDPPPIFASGPREASKVQRVWI